MLVILPDFYEGSRTLLKGTVHIVYAEIFFNGQNVACYVFILVYFVLCHVFALLLAPPGVSPLCLFNSSLVRTTPHFITLNGKSEVRVSHYPSFFNVSLGECDLPSLFVAFCVEVSSVIPHFAQLSWTLCYVTSSASAVQCYMIKLHNCNYL